MEVPIGRGISSPCATNIKLTTQQVFISKRVAYSRERERESVCVCAELLFGSVLVHIISFECPLEKNIYSKKRKKKKRKKQKKRRERG